MLVTFGIPFAQLRRSLAVADEVAPQRSAQPSASRRHEAATPLMLPPECWQQIASHLPLPDALQLRASNAWGFDVVAQSHRPELGAHLANLSLSPRHKHRHAELAPGILPGLLANERSLELSLDTFELDQARSRQQRRTVRRSRTPDARPSLDQHLFTRLQNVLVAAPNAERIRLPVGLFFSSAFADAPLRLPPNTRSLHLDQLFSPAFAHATRDLPAFFAANADRPVEHLMLSYTEGCPLGPALAQGPLFSWRLTSLALFGVALGAHDFARLLQGDFSALRSLTLLEAPLSSHRLYPVDEMLDGPQLKALCTLPWEKLEHLALAGTFDDGDMYALTSHSWPALTSLQLRGPNFGSASSRSLAALRAPNLTALSLRGAFDARALATLLQPQHAAYTTLSVLMQPQDSPRNVQYDLYVGPQSPRATPVRTLWLGQATPLFFPHVARLLAALQPFAHALQDLELHTCALTHEGGPWQEFATGLGPSSSQTALRRSHCAY